ncbi:MAG: glutamine-hydrolyzing carbamoyl-phosphate synthase small subunit [Elusimicrobia bacterium]|nr:glutamine-hydrolyzing carbamoyl-phosphate synthase small subunit [Elusimicrobiota bacterium]
MTKAILVLEDGTVFPGQSFGAAGECCGEVVFNTAMTGYQEIITDPSYKGQIVTMTYPEIGNYGVNLEDKESRKVFLEGFVVKEYSKIYSNWRARESLSDYLKQNNVPAIEGLDTRKLTKLLRTKGAMKAIISTVQFEPKNLLNKVKNSPGLVGRDLVREVTNPETCRWQTHTQDWLAIPAIKKYQVIAIDCGIKYNLLRLLESIGCEVTVVPAQTSAAAILAKNPAGVFISNGPGDPEPVSYVIETIHKLLGKKPIFGICLGHQLLALALGGKTYKLKFGHHGANHPFKNLATGKIEITAQNHGFCVDLNSLNQDEIEPTHINLNDHTNEGFRHKKYPAFGVQYHPEASPGPHDSRYLFDEFINLMEKHK